MKRLATSFILLVVLLIIGSSVLVGQTTIYVATTGSDATGDGTFGNPYATIQKAIDVATAGDIITVAAGSYNLTGSPSAGAAVDVGKSLTIQATDFMDGTPDNTTTILVGMESKAIDLRITASNVTVQGFTFDFNGAGTRSIGGIEPNGNPNLQNIHILNNVFELPDADPDFSFGEYVFRTGGSNDCSGLQINNNTFNASGTNGGLGVYLNPASSITGVQVNGNTFSGKVLQGIIVDGMSNVTIYDNTLSTSSVSGSGDNPKLVQITNWSGNPMTGVTIDSNVFGLGGANSGGKYSILLKNPGAGSVDDVTITDNSITDVQIAGIRQQDVVTGVVYTGNTIQYNPIGIEIVSGTVTSIGSNFIMNNTSDGIKILGGTVGSIENNNLSGNGGFAVNNTTGSVVDASPNWWGSADAATVVSKISGLVTFVPFYTDSGMTTLSSDPATVYVDDDYTSESAGGHAFGYDAFATIQEGIDAVATGGTVNVQGGTYDENVVVNESGIVISGNLAAVPTLLPSSGNGFTINAADVTLRYFGVAVNSTSTSVLVNSNDFTFEYSGVAAGANGTAVYVGAVSGAKIRFVEMDNSNVGLYAFQSTNLLIQQCDINTNTTGVVLDNVTTADLVNNTLSNNDEQGLILRNGTQFALVRKNTITGNQYHGILFHINAPTSGPYQNTVWNNTITGNGFAGPGEYDAYGGIYFGSGGAYFNSISANDIKDNMGWGVYDDGSGTYDNVVAMNNISGNTVGGVHWDPESGYLNAQHNWWGSSTGPSITTNNPVGAQLIEGDVISWFHKQSASDINRASLNADGPVWNDAQDKAYGSLGIALANANTSDVVQVKMSGLVAVQSGPFDNYTVKVDNLQLTGAGMNKSYVYMPYNTLTVGYWDMVYYHGDNVQIIGLDLDRGAFIDPETGELESIAYDGWSDYNMIDLAANDALVSANRIRGGEDGVDVYGMFLGSGGSTIQGNHIFWNNYAGVRLNNTQNIVSQNIIYQNGNLEVGEGNHPSGIYIGDSENEITQNTLANNGGHGIFIDDDENIVDNNIIGAANLMSVVLPDPIDWSSVTPDTKMSAPVGEAPIAPVVKKTDSDRKKKPLSLMELKKLVAERKAAALAERQARGAAYYGELQKAFDEKQKARATWLAQRRAERTGSSGVTTPLAKRASVGATIPVIAAQTLVGGNSAHGIRLYDSFNKITKNIIKENGTSYTRPDDFQTPQPSGISLGGSATGSLVAHNTISDNWFAGVKFHDGASMNAIWNNTINHNGYKTATGESVGAGIFFNEYGGYYNSVSSNAITNNVGYGVLFDNDDENSSDNIIVYNNITGNTVGGVRQWNASTTIIANHNWWGNASGPTVGDEAGDDVDESINYLFYQPTLLPVPQAATTLGPVVLNGNTVLLAPSQFFGEYGPGDIGPKVTESGNATSVSKKLSDVLPHVAIAPYTGVVEPLGIDIEYDEAILSGAAKDGNGRYRSYVHLPGFFGFPFGSMPSPIFIESSGTTVENIDIDNGGWIDNESGVWVGSSNSSSLAIVLSNVSDVIIQNNRVRGSSATGILAYESSNVEISNNEVLWNQQAGITLDYSDENTVTLNTVYQNGALRRNWENYSLTYDNAGIYLDNSDDNYITWNKVSNNGGQGILDWDGSFNRFEYNTVGKVLGNFVLPEPIDWSTADDGFIPGGRIADGQHGGVLEPQRRKGENKLSSSKHLTRAEARKLVDLRKQERAARRGSVTAEARLKRLLEATAKRSQANVAAKKQTSSVPVRKTSSEDGPSLPNIVSLTTLPGNMINGIKCYDNDFNTVNKNTAVDNGSSYSRTDGTYSDQGHRHPETAGIEISYGYQNTVEKNTISDNYFTGVKLTKNTSTTYLVGNTITGNGFATEENGSAVFLKNGASLNLVSQNIISGNNGSGIVISEFELEFKTADYPQGSNAASAAQTKGALIVEGNNFNIILGNVITDNGVFGVDIGANNTGELVNFNILSGHSGFGLQNQSTNPVEIVDGRFNYWGAVNGPGGGKNDPVTNKLADGSGVPVSENVLFDPFSSFVPSGGGGEMLEEGVADTVTVGGVTILFSSTGSGGLIALGTFGNAPPDGPFVDPDGGTYFAFLDRFWEIVTTMEGFDGSVTFSYAGLGIASGTVVQFRIAYRPSFSGSGVPWVLIPASQTTYDYLNQTVTITGVTSFSQWTILSPLNAPTVSSITPSEGLRGTTIQVNVTGTNFDNSATLNFGGDVTVNSVTVNSSTSISAYITIPAGAVMGQRTFTVTTAGGPTSHSFMILNPAPTVTAISPGGLNRGQSANVTFSGSGFLSGLGGTTLDLGSGITVGSVNVVSGNLMTAQLTIAGTAATGTRTISISNTAPGGGQASTSFTVTNPAPTAAGLTPNTGARGQTVDVTITGSGFYTGATTASFGDGVTVNAVNVLNATSLRVSLTINATASAGARDVTVTNAAPGGGEAKLVGAFTVTGPTSVEMLSALPTEFNLLQNYPNPFNPTTSIRFSLPEVSSVRLALYNTLGVEVQVLVSEELSPGVYQYRLRAEDLPSGMYIYSLRAQPTANKDARPFTSSKKLVLVK